MIEYYGSAFTFGEAPSATWIYHLQDLTAEQVGQGIRNLPRHESAFPPNPGEFKDLCLTDYDWEHRRLKYVEPIGIEDATAKERRRLEGIEAIRKLREESGL